MDGFGPFIRTWQAISAPSHRVTGHIVADIMQNNAIAIFPFAQQTLYARHRNMIDPSNDASS